MDAYLYRAALWCGPCVIRQLVEAGKASPGALGMPPAQALQQIVAANGFTDEADYDSDDLPKGPYAKWRRRSRYAAAL
jgi:protein involved in temperature-dependent protein secretion